MRVGNFWQREEVFRHEERISEAKKVNKGGVLLQEKN